MSQPSQPTRPTQPSRPSQPTPATPAIPAPEAGRPAQPGAYPPSLGGRRLWLAAVAALGVLAAILVPASSASAASYQYWGYYQLTGNAWAFSQKGAAQTTPADGAVEGWRWALDDGTGATPRTPRAVVTFDEVCGAVPAEAGKKRVAVVVDYGRAVDGDGSTTPPQPTADCAVVPTAATGAEVLAAVATVRNDNGGLVCGINNYPATGCGGQVATLTDEQKAADTPVTIAITATPLLSSEAATSSGGSPAGATPGTVPDSAQTAGPVASAPTATTSSGVPAVVWIGLVLLVLGAAALAWSSYRRRRTAA